MSAQPQAILGIDIAKQTFQVALFYHEKFKHKAFENNSKGFDSHLSYVNPK
jgi:transposase